jgi:class 3 adenylate cyclase
MSLKHKVALFLLAVIVGVTLGATLVVSLTMYRLVSAKQEREIRNIEASLSERFSVFEMMLHSQHHRITDHMESVLPLIAGEIKLLAATPAGLSDRDMRVLTKRYDIEHVYFIDRSHVVYRTDLRSDLGLEFPESDFTHFLDGVFGKGKVMSVGIDFSTKTGTLNTYSYYGPKDEDYIIETSTEIAPSLAEGEFGWMSNYFFKAIFADAASSEYVKDVDLYLLNDVAAWSLIHPGARLDPAAVENVAKLGRYEVTDATGRLVTIYSVDNSSSAASTLSPLVKRLVIRRITYDVSLAGQAVTNVVIGSLVVLVLALPLVFWLASYLLRRQMLNPLFALRQTAGAIAEGDLEHPVAGTARRDEIGHLATSFATMRDAVRRTINDLKETNAAIERFVPRAFLAIMGKPSIVSVKLGDNRRLDMTVLFSDIRNFTGLSEQMSPDENFAFINSYLARMGPVIRDHGGFIDKYIGDAIMALFERADDALRASLAMLDMLGTYNADRRANGLAPIGIGIGLNSGSLMLGTIGESNRMDGTVISDAVNLASRIEGLTKTYRISLLMSQYCYEQLANPGSHAIRPVDVVVVKGKTRPVTIYEVFDRNEATERSAKLQTRDLLLAGVEAMKGKDMARARALFGRCLELFPGDSAAENLLKSCGGADAVAAAVPAS